MKKILFALLLLPLAAVAEKPDSETLAQFKKLCANHPNPESRETYCKLVQDQIKAEQIMDDFS